jgi:hypothetical protein
MINVIKTDVKEDFIQWTPVLSSSGTAPTGWAMTAAGANEYYVVNDLVVCTIRFNTTGTPTAGTGLWRFSIPFPSKSNGVVCGDWYYYNNGPSGHGHVVVYTNYIMLAAITYAPSGTAVQIVGPSSLNLGYTNYGSISLNFFYERAR